jgi:ATP-dependent RNA helicase DeaD
MTAARKSDFSSLDLRGELLEALSALGYEEPTPVQREAIPPLLAGRDLLGQAATGTGKTAAFALPMLQRLPEARGAAKRPAGLVLVPTRELAMQVAEAVHKYGKTLRVSVLALYGGAPMGPQIRALERGAAVVVATPGRALDHIRRGTLALDELRMLVLDEADEMLDMGFADDLEAILEDTPEEKQTALFSATIPARILAIAERHLRRPVRVAIAREESAAGAIPRVRQVAYVVSRAHKPAALGRVLEMENPAAAIVFCRTRIEVDTLVEMLTAHGLSAEALHGGMQQRERDRVMGHVRSGSTDLLVATDVAARGLDIERISHVVNYDVPAAPEAYVHRIGRTGRAGRVGTAITLAEPREHRLLRIIERFTKQKIDVDTVPTVADLRARRLELTRASVRERLVAGDLDDVRVVVESLANEFDVVDIAAAAIKLAHAASGPDGFESEVPSAGARQAYEAAPDRTGAGHRGSRTRGTSPERPRSPARSPARALAPAGEVVRVFIGAGRQAGVRPADLVGAITGEAGIASRDLGAIEIADRYSLVEVPDGMADHVIQALRGSAIRGKKVTVRRER